MILVCYGMPKSASTFAYQMAIGLVEAAGHVQEQIVANLPEDLRADFFDDDQGDPFDLKALVEAVPQHSIRVIKTHGRVHKLGDILFSPTVKAIVTARDPRDAMLSAMDTARRELEEARDIGTGFTKLIDYDGALFFYEQQMKFALDWWKEPGFLRIPYRELALQPYRAAERMRLYLGLDVDSSAIADFFQEDKSRIVEYSTGTIGRFREHFDSNQIAAMNNVFDKGIVMFS